MQDFLRLIVIKQEAFRTAPVPMGYVLHQAVSFQHWLYLEMFPGIAVLTFEGFDLLKIWSVFGLCGTADQVESTCVSCAC